MKICTKAPQSIIRDILCAECQHDPRLHMNVKGGCLACQWEFFRFTMVPQESSAVLADMGGLKLDRLIEEAFELIEADFVPAQRDEWESKIGDKLVAIFEFGREVEKSGAHHPGQG